MVFHDGKYYLIYSANRWETADYGVGYAVCDTPMGPCRKPDNEPVLRAEGEALGPGGASFFTDEKGDLWLAYHAWRQPKVGYASGGRRSLHLGAVAFIRGKPVIGPLENQPR